MVYEVPECLTLVGSIEGDAPHGLIFEDEFILGCRHIDEVLVDAVVVNVAIIGDRISVVSTSLIEERHEGGSLVAR